jgi:hypothetical protein
MMHQNNSKIWIALSKAAADYRFPVQWGDKTKKLMEPTIGIEPMDLFLTKEALYRLSYVGTLRFRIFFAQRLGATKNKAGAGDEARTRDIQLGRLKLYQLSYSRFFTIAMMVVVLKPHIHTIIIADR